MRILLLAGLLALVAVPAAGAKEFGPGDLLLCDAKRCVAIADRPALAALSRLYYTGRTPPMRVRRPRLGAPVLELRFPNRYVTGIVATRSLDRFLSYGVHLERLKRGQWYRVEPAAAAELRRLSAGLRPYRLTQARLARSR